MCNNHYSDTSVTVIKTLMDALIDISVIADMAHKWRINTPPVKQNMPGLSFLTHWLLCKLAPIRRWKQPAKCSWLMCGRCAHDSPHR